MLVSLATVIAVFIFARKIFGIKIALAMSFLVAVCPEAISAATYAWNPHPMWLLLTVYIFSFFSLTNGNRKMNFFVWPVIGLMFSFQTALGTFIFLSSIIYLLIFNRDLFRDKKFGIGIGLFIVLLIPQIVFDLRHDFLMTKSIINLFSKTGTHGGFMRNLQTTFIDHSYGFSINFKSSFNNLLFSAISFYLLVFGVIFGEKIKLFKNHEYNFIALLTRIAVIIFTLLLFYQQTLIS